MQVNDLISSLEVHDNYHVFKKIAFIEHCVIDII